MDDGWKSIAATYRREIQYSIKTFSPFSDKLSTGNGMPLLQAQMGALWVGFQL